ncbi:MAG: hypothetical protein JWP97_5397 [Labilithrix sp.]|nr:hypothetical protein [Labilithrix sp.]
MKLSLESGGPSSHVPSVTSPAAPLDASARDSRIAEGGDAATKFTPGRDPDATASSTLGAELGTAGQAGRTYAAGARSPRCCAGLSPARLPARPACFASAGASGAGTYFHEGPTS